MKDLIDEIENLRVKVDTEDFGCSEKYFYNKAIDRVLDILKTYQQENRVERAGLTPEACGAKVPNTISDYGCELPKNHKGKHKVDTGQRTTIEWD